MEGVGVELGVGVTVGVGVDGADVEGDGLGLIDAILGVSLVIGTLPNTGCLYCGDGGDEVMEARRACELLLIVRSGLAVPQTSEAIVSSTFSTTVCTLFSISRFRFSFKFQEWAMTEVDGGGSGLVDDFAGTEDLRDSIAFSVTAAVGVLVGDL